MLTKNDETSTKYGSRRPAANSLQGHEHDGGEENATDGGEQTHGDVGDARLQVVFANVLEVEVAVETREPAGESNEHLGQGRVHVHEEPALDVLGSEAAKAREREKTPVLAQHQHHSQLS